METQSRTIYIENLSLVTTKDNLTELFSKFGKVQDIQLPLFPTEHPINKTRNSQGSTKTKGYAFIEFQDEAEAELARKFFNNLDNILISKEQGKEIQPDDQSGDNNLRAKVLQHDLFYRFQHMRVLSMQDYNRLSEEFKGRKIQSLIEAAKCFVVT